MLPAEHNVRLQPRAVAGGDCPSSDSLRCSKASLCASALSPSFHHQFKSSPSLMSLPRSHTGVGGSRNREIICADQAGVDHGFPRRSPIQLPHSELCFPSCRGVGFSTWRGVWVVGAASWGQESLCVGTQMDSNSGGQCAQELPALPSLLGPAPHTLDSCAPVAQAVMQSGGFENCLRIDLRLFHILDEVGLTQVG